MFKLSNQTQYGGGLNGGETAFAHLYIRSVFDFCKHHNLSASCLFIDILSAFANIFRRIIFDETHGDEAWLHKLSCMGFSDEDLFNIYNNICNHEWIDESINSQNRFNLNVLNSFYNNTFFTQESLPNAVHTSSGSMAGMPAADVVYSMVFARVLDVFRDSIQAEGLSSFLDLGHGGGGVELLDTTFHDDLAQPIIAPASEICEKSVKVLKKTGKLQQNA